MEDIIEYKKYYLPSFSIDLLTYLQISDFRSDESFLMCF